MRIFPHTATGQELEEITENGTNCASGEKSCGSGDKDHTRAGHRAFAFDKRSNFTD